MALLVTHRDTEGEPFSFSVVNALGKVPFCAAAWGISAVTIVFADVTRRACAVGHYDGAFNADKGP